MANDNDRTQAVSALVARAIELEAIVPPMPSEMPEADDVEGRAQVQTHWDWSAAASDLVGEEAGWDSDLLDAAFDRVRADPDEDREPPGHWVLWSAAQTAHKLRKPPEEIARMLLGSAVLCVLETAGEARSRWIEGTLIDVVKRRSDAAHVVDLARMAARMYLRGTVTAFVREGFLPQMPTAERFNSVLGSLLAALDDVERMLAYNRR